MNQYKFALGEIGNRRPARKILVFLSDRVALVRSCPARIRTWTKGTKIPCATIYTTGQRGFGPRIPCYISGPGPPRGEICGRSPCHNFSTSHQADPKLSFWPSGKPRRIARLRDYNQAPPFGKGPSLYASPNSLFSRWWNSCKARRADPLRNGTTAQVTKLGTFRRPTPQLLR